MKLRISFFSQSDPVTVEVRTSYARWKMNLKSSPRQLSRVTFPIEIEGNALVVEMNEEKCTFY